MIMAVPHVVLLKNGFIPFGEINTFPERTKEQARDRQVR